MKALTVLFCRLLAPLIVVCASLRLPPAASAAELTAFIAGARPGETWGTGFGGSFAITLFDVGGVEIEAARQRGAVAEASMISLSGRVFVAPPVGRFVPYGGLAAGFYRQKLESQDDWGVVKGAFIGVRFKVALSFQLRGEYEWLDLPAEALLPMDARYSLGATLRF
jgi:hypothetical protein